MAALPTLAWFSIASLIDHHYRRAQVMLRSARHARWELTQTWVYLRTATRADLFAYLDDAARERRLLSLLLRYRACGIEYLTDTQWQHIQQSAATAAETQHALRDAEPSRAPRPPWLAAAFDNPAGTASSPPISPPARRPRAAVDGTHTQRPRR